jgi:L-ribulose-5-phosphate 3-epimerase
MIGSLDRRQFLAAGTALCASAWLADRARSAPAPRKRNLKKAVGIGMIQIKGSLRQQFQVVKECGFDGVELDAPSDLAPDQVQEALQASGLAVSEVVDSKHWTVPLTDPDAAVRAKGRDALVAALEAAARFGATSVLLVPGIVDKQVSYDQAWERSVAEIKAVLPVAEKCGVTIAIENVWNDFLLSPLEAARYVDQFASPWVGFHFDVGNVVTFGFPEQWIRILGPRIKKLHIKEFSRKKRDDLGLWKGFDVELGEGDCDWPAVMTALDDIHYQGWATAEVKGGDVTRLKALATRMDLLFT